MDDLCFILVRDDDRVVDGSSLEILPLLQIDLRIGVMIR